MKHKKSQKGKGLNNIISNICETNGYEFQEILGSGKYGEVRSACSKEGCNYIAKISDLSNYGTDAYLNEIKIYKTLKDENITPTLFDNWICFYQDVPYGVLILERMDGNCDEYIKELLKCDSLNFEDCRKRIYSIFKKVYKILEKLEKYKILHRDPKADNWLYKIHNNKIKIYASDFGVSHKFGNDKLDKIFIRENEGKIIYDIIKSPSTFYPMFDFFTFLITTSRLIIYYTIEGGYKNFSDDFKISKIIQNMNDPKKIMDGYKTIQKFLV